MPNHRNRFPARRRFLKQSTALSATVALPHLARAAQPAPQEADAQATTPAPGTTATQPEPTTSPAPRAPLRRTREPRR